MLLSMYFIVCFFSVLAGMTLLNNALENRKRKIRRRRAYGRVYR